MAIYKIITEEHTIKTEVLLQHKTVYTQAQFETMITDIVRKIAPTLADNSDTIDEQLVLDLMIVHYGFTKVPIQAEIEYTKNYSFSKVNTLGTRPFDKIIYDAKEELATKPITEPIKPPIDEKVEGIK
jgi:hypothetical protein